MLIFSFAGMSQSADPVEKSVEVWSGSDSEDEVNKGSSTSSMQGIIQA